MLLTTPIPGPGLEFSPSLGIKRWLEADLPQGFMGPTQGGEVAMCSVVGIRRVGKGWVGLPSWGKGLSKSTPRGRNSEPWEEEQLGWVLTSCDRCNRWPQTGECLRKHELFSRGSGSGRSEIQVPAGLCSLQDCGGEPPFALLGLWLPALHGLWPHHPALPSSSGLAPPPWVSLNRTAVMGYGIHPKSRWSHLKILDLITSGTIRFSK